LQSKLKGNGISFLSERKERAVSTNENLATDVVYSRGRDGISTVTQKVPRKFVEDTNQRCDAACSQTRTEPTIEPSSGALKTGSQSRVANDSSTILGTSSGLLADYSNNPLCGRRNIHQYGRVVAP
jgi:hypothetical protein